MDYDTAVRAGELVLLKRQRDTARKECAAAFARLQQSKLNGTWTEATSAEYWQGPFKRFADLDAQILGLAPLQQATIDGLTGKKG